MTSDEKLLKILNAIQEARKTSEDPSLINLYITKADGLDDFDANEIWDIFNKLEQQEKILIIEGVPSIVNLHAGTDAETAIFSPQTHFSIKILDTFDEWLIQNFPKKELTESIGFDNQTCELKINNKTVLLRRATFRSELITLLFKNKKKVWEWEEIVGKIEGITDDDLLKDSKKKFYPACDGLQKFIAQKTGISDFLIFNKSTVQINPKYLKTPQDK